MITNPEQFLAEMSHVVPDYAYDGVDAPQPLYGKTHRIVSNIVERAVCDLVDATGMTHDYALMLMLDQILSKWGDGEFSWEKSE
jgi:hypothetical protein